MARSWCNTVSRARCRVWKYRGTAIVSNVPMMAITISSSINVNPRAERRGALPVTVGNPVQSLARRERVHVKDVVTRLRIIGRTCIAAQSPRPLRRHRPVRKERIARQTAQEIEVDFLLARRIHDALVKRLEIRGVTRDAEHERDVACIRGAFVRIDHLTYFSQGRTQLAFPLPLCHEL